MCWEYNSRVAGHLRIGQHMWARGYFCRIVGEVDQETIKRYIENQGKQEEENDNFTIAEESLLSVVPSSGFSQPQEEGFSPKCDFSRWSFSSTTNSILFSIGHLALMEPLCPSTMLRARESPMPKPLVPALRDLSVR